MSIFKSIARYPQHSFHQLSVLKYYHQPNQKLIEAPLRESITQWEHARQTVNVVRLECEKRGGKRDPFLEVAGVMHDLGHFVCAQQTLTPPLFRICVDVNSGVDDLHERVGANYLASLGYPKAITEPILYHGVAKIWLCENDSGYRSRLSEASKKSMELQRRGAGFNELYRQFLKSSYSGKAIMLRRCDDMAKETVNVEYPYYKTVDDVLALMYGVLFK